MSAWQTIQKMAHTLVATGESPTFAQAVDVVVCAHPDLYAHYEAEEVPEQPPVEKAVVISKKTGSLYSLEAVAKRLLAEKAAPNEGAAFLMACEQRPELVQQALVEERRR